MPREIRHDEEQIAELLRHLRRGAARVTLALGERRFELGDFLLGLGDNRCQRRPVESDPSAMGGARRSARQRAPSAR
jgi:hypothetical protein